MVQLFCYAKSQSIFAFKFAEQVVTYSQTHYNPCKFTCTHTQKHMKKPSMPPTYCHQSFKFHFLSICQRLISTFPTGQPTRILPQLLLCFPWMFILVFPLIRIHIQLTLRASFFLNKVNTIKIRSPLNRISFLNSISCQEAHNHCSVHQGLQEGRMLGRDLLHWTQLLCKSEQRVHKSRHSVSPVNPST